MDITKIKSVIDALPETNEYERALKFGMRYDLLYARNVETFLNKVQRDHDHYSRVTPETPESDDFKVGAYAIVAATKAILDVVKDIEAEEYCKDAVEILTSYGVDVYRAKSEALRLSQMHKPSEDYVLLAPEIIMPNGAKCIRVLNGDLRHDVLLDGVWYSLVEASKMYPGASFWRE